MVSLIGGIIGADHSRNTFSRTRRFDPRIFISCIQNIGDIRGSDTVKAHCCVGVLVMEVLEQNLQLLD